MIWTLVIIAFIITALWFYRYFVKREAASAALAEKERMEKLMHEGVRIVVDLNQCEIRTGSFMLESPELEQVNDVTMMDAMVGAEHPEESNVVEQTFLLHTHTLDTGETIRFLGPTFKGKKTVQILCAMQGTTFLYYDRNDPHTYYFDLRFLE